MPTAKNKKSADVNLPLANSVIASSNFLPPAPKTIGPDSKKANSAADFLFKPVNIPVEIVTPEREIPGIRAMLWEKPISNDFKTVIFSSLKSCFPSLSARKIIRLPASRPKATTLGWRKTVSIFSSSKDQ